MKHWIALLAATLIVPVLACSSGGSDNGADVPVTTSTPEAPVATATPSPTATPQRIRQDILATRLRIPALEVNAPVVQAETIPDTSVALPGCPARPPGEETLTVPNEGLATPGELLEGFENKAWIFGHSRWLGVPGLFYRLEDLNRGDEIFLTGTNRDSGATVSDQRYVVTELYLADTDTGGDVIAAETEADIPLKPQVILQTSVREDGPGKSWILKQDTIMAKAQNAVPGDIDDPCKYLILFVVADLA